MLQAHKFLIDEITKLPIDKIGKALSFVRYIGQETEHELVIDPIEETELMEIYASGDMVDASELLKKIKELPDD